MSESTASACVITGARGGGGAMTIAPVPVPGGGYGSAEFLFARTNEPGSEIEMTPEGCRIKHGVLRQAQDERVGPLQERLDTLEAAISALIRMIAEAASRTGGGI